jgi:hypothetical protein
MIVREVRPADWAQIWPFFREIVEEGETYAYPDDLTAEQAQALWAPGPGPGPWSPATGAPCWAPRP